jgi:pyroglutamyl-peptidase
MPVLACAFEPFGGRAVNRSWEVLERLPADLGLWRARVPVDFAELHQVIPALVSRRPVGLLLCGESWRDGHVRLERLGRNIVHATTPDNKGREPRFDVVVPGGPVSYDTTWDLDTALAAVRRLRVPVEISEDAGTYACNAALYLALHAASTLEAPPRIGFLHLPARGWPIGPSTATLCRVLKEVLLTMSTPRVN